MQLTINLNDFHRGRNPNGTCSARLSIVVPVVFVGFDAAAGWQRLLDLLL